MYQLLNFEFVNWRNITQPKSKRSRIGNNIEFFEYSEVDDEFNFNFNRVMNQR